MKKIITITAICALAHLGFSQDFGIGVSAPSQKLDVAGNAAINGQILNFTNLIGKTDATMQHLVLDSKSSGDNWTSQGAYISLGEAGNLGSASMHLTYRGDGYGFVGAGTVTNAEPRSYWRFDYNADDIYTEDNVTIGTLSGTGNRMVIADANGTLSTISLPGTTLGNLVQMKSVQTRTETTYAAPVSGNGTVITPLNIVITPRKAGNAIVLKWVVNGEIGENAVWNVTRNSTLLANSNSGSRWEGIASNTYDKNESSTMSNIVVSIIDFNTLSTATTYSLLIRSSNSTAQTYYLNRCIGNAGADSNENALSTGTAREIEQ